MCDSTEANIYVYEKKYKMKAKKIILGMIGIGIRG